MLDIFNQDAFSVISLTDAINKVKYVPGRIGELGLFSPSGVSVTTIAIEEQDGILVLVAPTPRGGPGITVDKSKRTLRNLNVPHFEINDAVMAEEVQGVRAWGSETAVEMIVGKLAERFTIHTQSMAATEEYARIGAVKGIVTYADGSTLDLFAEFNVSQITEIDFDLNAASPVDGILRQRCASVGRTIADELGGLPYRALHAFCGDNFFDDLIKHSEVPRHL
ncbi:MAG: major capsid protein [Pseudomonadota bacterium]